MASRKSPVFEIYQDKKGEWRWRARAQNGNLLASASEGYADKRDAVHCAKLFGYDPVAAREAAKAAAAKEAAAAAKASRAKPGKGLATVPAAKPKRVAKPKAPKPAPETPAEG